MIANGADVNSPNKFGETPIHGAGNLAMLVLLLSKGADIRTSNS